jgi:hypothetical protein
MNEIQNADEVQTPTRGAGMSAKSKPSAVCSVTHVGSANVLIANLALFRTGRGARIPGQPKVTLL